MSVSAWVKEKAEQMAAVRPHDKAPLVSCVLGLAFGSPEAPTVRLVVPYELWAGLQIGDVLNVELTVHAAAKPAERA